MTEPKEKFSALQDTAETQGAVAVLEKLAELLQEEKKLPQLFDALLMRKRYELGLPLQGTDSVCDLPEDVQVDVENYYIESCRKVGSLFLEQGDIPGAWPYFRAIDEPRKVAEAIDRWEPEPPADDVSSGYEDNSATDAVVQIALNEGVNPTRGFELILENSGLCRAITTFEHQLSQGPEVEAECCGKLVRRLYSDLLHAIKGEMQSREVVPPEDSDVERLIEALPWLFEDIGCLVDTSHLQSVVRFSIALKEEEDLRLALQLTEYGRRLPREHESTEPAPFEDFYNDHRILLKALLRVGTDGAVRFFTVKANQVTTDEEGKHLPGEVLVHLLYRLERYSEAIEAHEKYLQHVSELSLAPSLLELSEAAGDYSRFLALAQERDDLLQFAVALVKKTGEVPPPD